MYGFRTSGDIQAKTFRQARVRGLVKFRKNHLQILQQLCNYTVLIGFSATFELFIPVNSGNTLIRVLRCARQVRASLALLRDT